MNPIDQDKLISLFQKYRLRQCTPEELRQFVQLLQDPEAEALLLPELEKIWSETAEAPVNAAVDWSSMYTSITSGNQINSTSENQINDTSENQIKRQARIIPVWMRVAAAVVLIVGASALFFLLNNRRSAETTGIPQQVAADIQPGGNHATLLLADGSVISLDTAQQGQLAEQGNIKVVKQDNGSLVYKGSANEEMIYNIISTPTGGQYRVDLPDGSRVWLNAVSSLRFPVSFTGTERRVELTGEAFFEIAANPAMPFRVVNRDLVVEVLGTEFNVMSYSDEPSQKTTLLEGKVKISRNGQEAVLAPGQQAISGNETLNVVSADVAMATAWKNGFFQVENEDVQSIMRQLSRWYDVTVRYENGIPDKRFAGSIPRDMSLLKVLKILELGGLHFTFEGRTITVKQ